MSSEGIGIKSSLIKLEGIVTANNYFKINSDGSMETKSATIGGWKVNDTAIYKDVVSGNTTYRVWFQPPLTNYPDVRLYYLAKRKRVVIHSQQTLFYILTEKLGLEQQP